MTSRIWIGGGNDNVGNANDWSPFGVPLPGDTLNMQTGAMNIRGDDLAGNTLMIGGSSLTTLNLSHHAAVSVDIAQESVDQVTVNVKGSDTLNIHTEFPSSGNFTINLADHASLTANFNMVFSSAVINGGDDSRFTGGGLLEGSHVTIHARASGGSFAVQTAQSIPGRVEFGGSVSHNESVAVRGDPGRGIASQVQIDQPGEFKGAVALGVFGEVDLMGLVNASSYAIKNDILSIYSGHKVIDNLRLTTPPAPGLPTFNITVAQTSAGIVIDRGVFHGNGTLLPVHSSGHV
ncbi:MAG TPA: hypothetical protein VNW90_28530 [Acetobacteraceae bacterium]|nr:hypothetical protein [Acetobacteraceae bacterium]